MDLDQPENNIIEIDVPDDTISSSPTIKNDITEEQKYPHDKIFEWIKSSGLKFEKINERPWGSYSLKLSWDGNHYITSPRTFGSAYSVEEAFSIELYELFSTNTVPNIVLSWLGTERCEQIRKLIN